MRQPPSQATVDLGAYEHNLNIVRGILPEDTKVCAIVKANAYGHGMIPVAKRAAQAGVHMLGVALVGEGTALREAGIETPILVMGQPLEDALADAAAHGLDVALSDRKAIETTAKAAQAQSVCTGVHLKVDTGMGRQGCAPDEALDLARRISESPHLHLAGLMTHFPIADAPETAFTLAQTARLSTIARSLRAAHIAPATVHAANSAAIVQLPQTAFGMVRPGLMAYGVWPLQRNNSDSPLRPVLRWETRVVLTKSIPAGASVGYGCTFRAIHPMRIAVLPVGYADGYPFQAGNHGHVLIQGRPCRLLGRVSMDQITVDITGVPEAAPGETAILIGRQGAESICTNDLAHWGNTIAYDILVGLGPRVERIYKS